MAQDKKVEQITSMEDDFAQWYTDICRKAELVEYASVKGFHHPASLRLRYLGKHSADHGRRVQKDRT